MAKRKSKYEKLECSKDEFESDKDIQMGNGTPFMEHVKGGRSRLIVYDKPISATFSTNRLDLGNLGKLKFTAFLGRFNKQLYKRFRTIEKLFDIDIKFEGKSKSKNKDVWDALKPGQVFYNIDIRTAYWQIGYWLGYIDHALYIDLLHDDDHKQAKRYCFSFLKRQNYTIYHVGKKQTKIECDTNVLIKVLDNVRKKLYCEIDEVKMGCPGVIEWDTDGVYCLADDLAVIRERLKAKNLLYKITFCRKIDEYTYDYAGKIKNFKLKPKSL